MQLHLTIDLRAVLIGFVLLLVAAGVATPFAISLAHDGDGAERSSEQRAILGTAFTYQGRLDTGSGPANGPHDFQAILREDIDGLVIVPGTSLITLPDVAVTNGLFSIDLDFLAPAAFNGQARFLELRIRPGAETGPFTQLSPLQRLAPVPYAIYAQNAGSALTAVSVPWSGIANIPPQIGDGLDADTLAALACTNGQVAKRQAGAWVCAEDVIGSPGNTYTAAPGGGLVLDVTAFSTDTTYLQRRVTPGCGPNSSIRTINQDGTAVCETDDEGADWKLTGNNGTTGANFLGTTDNTPLELRVNGQRALRIEPNATSPNVIGGFSANAVTAGVFGATIGGGGLAGVGSNNRVTDNYGTVAGGEGNRAGDGAGATNDRRWATVGGGISNTASGEYSTVAGGSNNIASGFVATVPGGNNNTASSAYATVAGGNANAASGTSSTVGGGNNNTASSDYATVGGGLSNSASGGAYATVGGGHGNAASNLHATVGGGSFNTASAYGSTVGGGISNTASSDYATVGGGNANVASGSRATVGGGYNNIASGDYATVPGGYQNIAQGPYSFAAGYSARSNGQGSFTWSDTSGAFVTHGANTFEARATGGVYFTVRASPLQYCQLTTASIAWQCSSDRNLKANFEDVDGREVLARLEDVPIQRWTTKDVEGAPPHMGPMAQDFYAAFGLGGDDKSISTIDLDGVSLAAIKGLHAITKEQQAQIDALRSGALTPNPSPDFAGEGSTGATPGPVAPQVTVVRQSVGPSNGVLLGLMFVGALLTIAIAGHTVVVARAHSRRLA